MDLMWFLLLSHLVGDYALQTDRMARTKGTSLTQLTWHVSTYAVTVGIAVALFGAVTHRFEVWSWTVFLPLLIIFTLHWVQDLIKARHFHDSRQAYYIDRALHVVQLFLLRWWLG